METLHLLVHKNPVQEYSIDNACFADNKSYVIGSGKACNLVIDDPSVDVLHAIVARQDNKYYLADLDSGQGTRIGRIRLQPKQGYLLSHGTLIQVGNVIIEVEIITPALQQPSSAQVKMRSPFITTSGLRLDAIGLNKSSRPMFGTTLLNDISLSFLPREFVVIAGVSGGGKSTLMNALNGQRRAKGKVLIDGTDLYKNYNAFKNRIGYVPQDDIVHLDLTVSEALNYAVQLRLPFASTNLQQERVKEVIEQLQLTVQKNLPIARLSGGQRKRVSIGVELISHPSLFFLDEATTGLDPGTERQIMEVLRYVADAGSTVILITHATKNVALANLVVFLAKGGRLAYVGPPKLAFKYFQVQDFDAIYDKVERQRTPQQWENYFRVSPYYERFISERIEGLPPRSSIPSALKLSFMQQVSVLCRRNLAILLKNKMSLALMILGAPILGSLNFALWKSDLFSTKSGNAGQAISMLFVVVIMAVMSGSLATMSEIAKERPIYKRERSVGLEVAPYLASKLFVALILAIYQSAVLLWFMLAAVEIPGAATNITGMYFTLFLASFSSCVMGLIISAIAPNQSVAPLLILIALVLQIVFGGGIKATDHLDDNAKSFSQLMVSKYSFESLVSLSGLGTDVADDVCWQKSEYQRKSLPLAQIAQCKCYGKNVFTKCKFPGIGRFKRSSSLNNDFLKVNLLIQGILDGYESVFYTDVNENNFALIKLATAMIGIIFVVLLMKIN
ncbi:ATP-binding cassette domain-containing protein [Nostoc sp. FACHB-152]|uniref:ATP-binding cassette domain-containing protein n=1 Tax=Nostoc sp. FACHB-152 TaxID=2692837 RepID=UPI001684A8E3|nr:ATP-binding cassette domain-containing protein [Nostoc sp. FACHB-152]MBD2450490.1 ATP-binding cassette domain-containing protein [Nostoc sp. FACHB-152]